ncbi:MotA/TolQ/ExbB proton channel family protein [Vibrio sp. NTOU-M3]|uniref:MotA/TolQ/ExbB proton channel family protein n=1 Tax=Vibrio sp. NTOU-M3 TaxID=3234954 RepID=UPI00349FC0EF
MKLKLITSAICLAVLSFNVSATAELATKTKQEAAVEQKHNAVRESSFKTVERDLAKIKAELNAKKAFFQANTEKLAEQFSKNEDQLARLEEQLRLETGSLGELFGVVRQNAKELRDEIKYSVTSVDHNENTQLVDQIVASESLPSMPQLTALWKVMEQQIAASSEVAEVQVSFVNGEGKKQSISATRVGSFGLIAEDGFIQWNGARGEAKAYIKQPDNAPTSKTVSGLFLGDTVTMVLDPSRGIMLEQLALTPSAMDRLQAGGVVGKIILGLLAIGLIIAVVRGASLATARSKIKNQLKNPAQPGDNPLGRVLSVYQSEQNRSVEALELRLLEAVVDEQTGLERGLSMLKLLAALAPMLGLLGTVTGMIETFQVITQFGNGDPKVMAGGISMALVTTVLGLIAAMPLLLAHNILSTQAENIRNILEKQGIGLVAEEAERESVAANTNTVGNAA